MRRVQRFPRLPDPIMEGRGFSMNVVWQTLDRIWEGKKVSSGSLLLAQRWLGTEEITPDLIRQYRREEFDGHFRFPRQERR